MSNFRNNSLKVCLVYANYSIPQFNLSYVRLLHLQNPRFFTMKNFGYFMRQNFNYYTRQYPFKLLLLLFYLLPFSLFLFIFLFVFNLLNQFINVFLFCLISLAYVYCRILLILLDLREQFTGLISFLGQIEPKLLILQIDFFNIFILFPQFLSYLSQSFCFHLSYSIHSVLQPLFDYLLLSLFSLKQLFFFFLFHKVSCFTYHISNFTIWNFSNYLKISYILSQMLNKLRQTFPTSKIKFDMMFILGILLINILNIFCLSWVFSFQYLNYSILELV